jgi:hypothetical protein
VAYDPAGDLFLWPWGHAYDPGKNRWVLAKIAVEKGAVLAGLSGGLAYDARRKVFWTADSGGNGGVSVMRFDPAKAEIQPLKDYVPAAPPAPPAGK